MKDKKYEFVPGSEITICSGTTLMRIRALRDFGDVKKGDIGGQGLIICGELGASTALARS